MQIQRLRLFAGIVIVTFTLSGAAYARTRTVTCQSSGNGVNVPIDLDSDSCFTTSNNTVVCTDSSIYNNLGFNCSPDGPRTGNNLFEFDRVKGTGCNIFGTIVPGMASCTLANGSEQGCAFQSVGGAEVDRFKNGDLLFLSGTVTDCIDLSSGPPFNFTGALNSTITGGTGANAGAKGSAKGTLNGQILISDAAAHGLSWLQSNFTITITTK